MADKLEEALKEVQQGLEGANAATAAFAEKLKAFRSIGDELALNTIRRELGEQFKGVPIILAIRKIKADLGMAQVDAKAQAGIAEMRNNKIAQMKRALDNYKTDLEEARKVNGDIYLRYVEAESLANRRNAELTVKSEELAEARQKYAKLQSVCSHTAAEADKIGDEYAVMSGDLAERDRVIDELHDETDGYRKKIADLKKQIERLNAGWATDQGNLRAAQRDSELFQERFSAANYEILSLKQQCEKLMKLHDDAEERARSAGCNAAGIWERELAERDRTIKELRDVLKGERLAAGTKIGQLERELKAADGHYQSLARACVAQAVEITRLKEPK